MANNLIMSKVSASSLTVKAAIASLLATSLSILPRLTARAGIQSTSQDRPELPWLTPLTAAPVNTVAGHLFGSLCILFVWSSFLNRRTTLTDCINALLGVTCSSAIVFGCVMSLGAPLNSFLMRSLLLSLQLSALAVFPFFYSYGIPRLDDKGIGQRYRLTRLLCSLAPENPLERAVTLPGLGAVIGAFIGVIPLALDWDRPWQSYPLAPVTCATVGFVVGMFA